MLDKWFLYVVNLMDVSLQSCSLHVSPINDEFVLFKVTYSCESFINANVQDITP